MSSAPPSGSAESPKTFIFYAHVLLTVGAESHTQITRDALAQGKVAVDVRLLLGLVNRRAARHGRHLPLCLLLPIPPIPHRPLHRRLDGLGRSTDMRPIFQHQQVVPRRQHGHRFDHPTL